MEGAGIVEARDVPVTVLLSGGLDSAACLFFYLQSGSVVDALFIDYGQPAAQFERAAAMAIAADCGVSLAVVECDGLRAEPTSDVPGRNGFLYFTALVHGGSRERLIASGIHDGTPFYDCSPRFIERMDSVVSEQTRGRIRLVAPFMRWTKRMIWQFCEDQRVPIQLTRSCDSGAATYCGRCLSCLDRIKLP
jgi:7-cyano-7-deazaguanine synthase